VWLFFCLGRFFSRKWKPGVVFSAEVDRLKNPDARMALEVGNAGKRERRAFS